LIRFEIATGNRSPLATRTIAQNVRAKTLGKGMPHV
jgi:hypothetical protein